MKKIFVLITIFFSIGIYSQEPIIQLPQFPNYFNVATDSINFYKKGSFKRGWIKSIKSETNCGNCINFNFKKLYDAYGKQVTKNGQQIYLIKTTNDSIKRKEVYVLNGFPDAEDRPTNSKGYYLSQVFTYTANNQIASFKIIDDNLSETLQTYTYNSNNQLLSITEEIFVPLVEVSENDEVTYYRSSEPNYTQTTKAAYQNNLITNIISTLQSDNTYAFDEQLIDNIIYTYNQDNLVETIVAKSKTINRKTNAVTAMETKNVAISYTPNKKIKQVAVSFKNALKEPASITTNFTYNKKNQTTVISKKSVNVLEDEEKTNTQETTIVYNKNNHIFLIKEKFKEDVEPDVTTFKYQYYNK